MYSKNSLKKDEPLRIQEKMKLKEKDCLIILLHHGHLFTLLYLYKEKLIYLTDGNNTYIKNNIVKKVIIPLIPKGIEIRPLTNNFQTDADHCGKAAILAGIVFTAWYRAKIGEPQMMNIGAWIRKRITKIFREKSEKIAGYKNNINDIPLQKCCMCNKNFRYNKLKLAQHMRMAHK